MNYTHKYAMQLNEEIVSHEDTYNIILDSQKLYILRFDGVRMTKNFLGNPELRTPFFKTMKEMLQKFMENNLNLKFAYSFSDEISILLSKEVLEEYDYRLEKIISNGMFVNLSHNSVACFKPVPFKSKSIPEPWIFFCKFKSVSPWRNI